MFFCLVYQIGFCVLTFLTQKKLIFLQILILLLSIIQLQQSQSLSIKVPNEKLKVNKRDAIYGDLSYSYSATDVGAEGGGHVKTVTVIKNISKGKHDYTNADNKNIKLIVKWPEITSDVFSTLNFFTSAETTPKVQSEEKIAETTKTETNNEVVETKTESIKIVEEEKKPEKQMEDVPKQDVELLEPSQPIGLNAAIQSAKAQANAQLIRARIDNAVVKKSENFSDFSMHTIRHLNNQNSKKEISVKIVKKEPYIAPILRTKIPK